MLLDRHANDNENAWRGFEVLWCRHAVLVVVDEGCNCSCLVRCWCTQEKLNVACDTELIALSVELAKQLGIRDGSLHQFVDNLHTQPLTIEYADKLVRLYTPDRAKKFQRNILFFLKIILEGSG